MTQIAHRVALGSGAQGIGLLVRTAEQLLLVPIFLTAWGVELFGEWLLISAIPIYLSISDFGFAAAASNELARRSESGITENVRQFFGRLLIYYSKLLLGLGVVACFLVLIAPIRAWLHLSLMSDVEAKIVFALLILQTLASQQSLILNAAMRATQRYHKDAGLRAALAMMRLLFVIAGVSFLGFGPIEVAATMAFTWSVLCVLEVFWLRISKLPVAPRRSQVGDESLRPYFLLGLDFMLLPLAQAIILQGAILVVGTFVGVVAVVVFSTHRTLARMCLQIVQIATMPLQAEVGLMQEEKHRKQLIQLVIIVSRFAFWTASFLTVFFLIIGPWVFETWTRGEFTFERKLFLPLVLAALFEGIWRAASSVRLGTNRHQPLTRGYLMICLLGLSLAAVIAQQTGQLGLIGLSFALVELAMVVLTVKMNRDILHVGAMEYLSGILRTPLDEIQMIAGKLRNRD